MKLLIQNIAKILGLILVLGNLSVQGQSPEGMVIGQDLPNYDRTWYFCPEGNVQMIEDVFPEKSIYQGRWHYNNGTLYITLSLHYGKRGIGEAWVKENTRGFNEFTDFVHIVKENLQFEWNKMINSDSISSSQFSIVKSNNKCPANFYSPQLPGQFPIASYRVLSDQDLEGMSLEELSQMRLEIYARYGLKFMSTSIMEYFMEKAWYFPDKASVDIYLTNIEKRNIRTIAALERKLKH